jgi:hypothetical protein
MNAKTTLKVPIIKGLPLQTRNQGFLIHLISMKYLLNN